MQRTAFIIGALVLAFGTVCNPAVLRADPAWTMHDLDQVADAAVVSLIRTQNVASRSWMLIGLADALIKAGDPAHAKNILRGAATDLAAPADFMSSASRATIVGQLAKIGDDADAQALITADAPKEIQANLVTELAIGRAEAGNIAGVRESVQKITPLAASTDSKLAQASQLDLERIGIALVQAGATDDAFQIAKNLPDKTLSAPLVADVATALCRASKVERGRALAETAAADARTAVRSVKLPYLMFTPITSASKALVACESLESAAAFVSTAIPAGTKDITRDALLNQIGNADLALAVSPLPRPGNLSDSFRRSELLIRTGNIAEATETLSDALKIISQNRRTQVEMIGQTAALGRLAESLAKRSAYDSALAAAKATPAANRNQYDLIILSEAVTHKDNANVKKLVPVILEAFSDPAVNAFQRQTSLQNLILVLANGGYGEEAQAIFKQLSMPSRTIVSPLPVRIQPAKLAELRAALGELSAALQAANAAGPLVSPPSAMQIMALASMQFAGHPHPTRDQALAAILRAKAMLPAQIAGPRAWAYSAAARELALSGDVENAREFETKLEAEPRVALAAPRDAALAGIAEAQIKAGDLRDAFATASQMSKGGGPQWQVLLSLASQPPRH
jgi:tetratricopeptide (TPR) repeat protein